MWFGSAYTARTRKPPRDIRACGFDITYAPDINGAFSIINDCLFICRWHGCDKEGTAFLAYFNALNPNGLFDDAETALPVYEILPQLRLVGARRILPVRNIPKAARCCGQNLPRSTQMTNLQTYLQTKLRGILSSWDEEGIYAISFLVSGQSRRRNTEDAPM